MIGAGTWLRRLVATPHGRDALANLLKAQLRSPMSDMNRLALMLKLRFLHHLPREQQHSQKKVYRAHAAGGLLLVARAGVAEV